MKYYEIIKDPKLKNAVKMMLSDWGYKLRFIPSSMTGHYHPPDEHGLEGLIRHIEKLCWFLLCCSDEFQWDQDTLDEMLTAAYFHDIGKVVDTRVEQKVVYQKMKKVTRKVVVSRRVETGDHHPVVSAKVAEEYMKRAKVPSARIKRIKRIILSHMGHWYKGLPEPTTELERLFALGDFIVSRPEFRLVQEHWLKTLFRWLYLGIK